MAEFEKMDLASADLVAERIDQLKQLLPEVATEGGIDFEKLRLVLGDEVDEGTERYAFTWPGKTDAIRQSQTLSAATLRPCPGESVNWDETENLYIEGDNLEVLKLLQHSYHGKIKTIFIDPPYNTGSDFVYKDSFENSVRNYLEQSALNGQAHPETDGRFHSDWCSMMYPRLRLARELLADDGSIFVSIDFNEVANLRKIMDEVFGENNFQREIIWRIGWLSGYKTTAPNFIRNHDTILYYSKDSSQFSFIKKYIHNHDFKPLVKKEPKIKAMMASLGLSAKQQDELLQFINYENRPDKYPIEDTWNSNEYDDLNSIAIVSFSGEKISKVLDVDQDFKGQKSVKMLQRIIEATTAEGDIVLDFFSGTGSTAHAVWTQCIQDGLSRNFILVQLPEGLDKDSTAYKAGYSNICEIGKERIRRVGSRIAVEAKEANRQLRLGVEPKPIPDIGFRVLKLDESGIERPKPGELLLDVVKPDRSDEDIIFEMMLKWGLELTLPIEKVDAAGYPCYSVAYGELVCCLAPGINMQVLDAIADMEPRRVLMLDRNLDDTTKLNAVQAFKRVEEKTGREVELRTV